MQKNADYMNQKKDANKNNKTTDRHRAKKWEGREKSALKIKKNTKNVKKICS